MPVGNWGTSLIAVNITGLAVGAAATVPGVAENAFSVGMAAGWYNGAWAIGALVMGLGGCGKIGRLIAQRFQNCLNGIMIQGDALLALLV